MTRFEATCALVLALALTGCTTPEPTSQEAPWHGRDLDDDWTQFPEPGLKPCQVLELDFLFDVTTTWAWDWVSVNQQALRFDVHTHQGNDTLVLHSMTGLQDQGEMAFRGGQVYSLTWTHGDASGVPADLWFQAPPYPGASLGALPPAECSPEATPM